jgi:hypothetical protein
MRGRETDAGGISGTKKGCFETGRPPYDVSGRPEIRDLGRPSAFAFADVIIVCCYRAWMFPRLLGIFSVGYREDGSQKLWHVYVYFFVLFPFSGFAFVPVNRSMYKVSEN